jgi:cytoskeletal protein CcmA (bactofilin family)
LNEIADSQSIDIDPVAMNIVNRVAAGTVQRGSCRWVGGLLVQGRIEGDLEVVGGPLVLMPGGEIAGNVRGDGEAYLFGNVLAKSENELSELDIAGTVYLAETLHAQANITAGAFKSWEGAQVEGRIKTMKRIASAA